MKPDTALELYRMLKQVREHIEEGHSIIAGSLAHRELATMIEKIETEEREAAERNKREIGRQELNGIKTYIGAAEPRLTRAQVKQLEEIRAEYCDKAPHSCLDVDSDCSFCLMEALRLKGLLMEELAENGETIRRDRQFRVVDIAERFLISPEDAMRRRLELWHE